MVLVTLSSQAKPIWVQITPLSSKSHVTLDGLLNPLLSVSAPLQNEGNDNKTYLYWLLEGLNESHI